MARIKAHSINLINSETSPVTGKRSLNAVSSENLFFNICYEAVWRKSVWFFSSFPIFCQLDSIHSLNFRSYRQTRPFAPDHIQIVIE